MYPGFVEQLKNDSVNKDRGIYDFEVRSFWLSVIKLLTGVIKLLQVYCYLYIDQTCLTNEAVTIIDDEEKSKVPWKLNNTMGTFAVITFNDANCQYAGDEWKFSFCCKG